MKLALGLVAFATVAWINGSSAADCQSDADERRSFDDTQMTDLKQCKQLTKLLCIFVHEARSKCPCTCLERDEGINEDGEPSDLDKPSEPPADEDEELKPLDGKESEEEGEGGEEGDDEEGDGKDKDSDKASDDPKSKEGMENGEFCFDGTGMVETNLGSMSMDELLQKTAASPTIIKLMAWDSVENVQKLSPLKYWMHADPSVRTKFITINLISSIDKSIRLTPNHLIHTSKACTGPLTPIPAEHVTESDCLKLSDSERLQPIESISESHESTGIYAPVTEEGTVIVNGIVASCYAHSEHEPLARFTLSLIHSAHQVFGYFLPGSTVDALMGSFSSTNVHKSASNVLMSFNRLQKLFL